MALKELLTKFTAMIQGTTSDATRDLLENLQKSLEYCVEENAILWEVVASRNPGKPLHLSGEQKRRLARKAVNLKKCLLADVTELYRPENILDWYRAHLLLLGILVDGKPKVADHREWDICMRVICYTAHT